MIVRAKPCGCLLETTRDNRGRPLPRVAPIHQCCPTCVGREALSDDHHGHRTAFAVVWGLRRSDQPTHWPVPGAYRRFA